MSDEEIDVDAPIPYVLTALALRELQQWRDEENFPPCPHEWESCRLGLHCINCGTTKVISTSPSIPSYLGPKSDWKRR